MTGIRLPIRQLIAVALTAALNVAGALAAGQSRIDYANPAMWLCRPGRTDACVVDLTTTVVDQNGKRTIERFRADPNAPIDCFYVYPTVSRERTPLSDMTVGPGEREIVQQQFARFGSKCRLYAPLYRQFTLVALAAEESGRIPDVNPVIPADDVIDAWNSYLARDNGGRGFVLIAHSQGAAILKRIVEVLIDGTPIAKRLVSVIIPGTNVDVPLGKDVGGTFPTLPLCRAATQTGCVIAYSSFLASDPPGDAARFGISSSPGMSDACVNPALLDTNRTSLDAYLPAFPIETATVKFDTPFFKVPGLLSARCVSEPKHTYLAISMKTDQRAPLVLPLLHDIYRHTGWGLHALDINFAIGNLVDLVGKQSRAWLAHNGPAVTAR